MKLDEALKELDEALKDFNEGTEYEEWVQALSRVGHRALDGATDEFAKALMGQIDFELPRIQEFKEDMEEEAREIPDVIFVCGKTHENCKTIEATDGVEAVIIDGVTYKPES